jgi:tripartite motif-containing protein 71
MTDAPETGAWEAIWMGVEDTLTEDGWYPAEWDVRFDELSIFEKKVTFGQIDKDSDDIISSYIISDLTGGGQVDMMTGADQTRYRHGILDARKPGAITLPQYVQEWTPGSGTFTTYPLGNIGDYPYVLKNEATPKVYAWDEATDASGNSVSATGGGTPYGKPVRFNDRIFIPYGTSGYAYVAESVPGTPTWSGVLAGVAEGASPSATSNPTVVDFEVWDERIWALTTTGALAYSFTGSTGAWAWDQSYNYATARFMKIETSRTPTALVTYADNNGDPCLFVVVNGSAYRVDFVGKTYEKTTIQFAPHPDFGRGSCVWRPGEDLKIPVGLGMVNYTSAGVVDPETGLDRNDGMPFDALGKIIDLEPEVSNLYALVSGYNTTATSFAWAAKVGATGTGNGQFAVPRGVAADSTADVWVADENNERVQRFSSALAYEAQGAASSPAPVNNDSYYDVALDGSDNLFVVDHGNSVIHKRTFAGGVWSTVVDGRHSTTAFALQNTYGPVFNGLALSNPCQVAVDGTGRILVADTGNNRLVILTSLGAYSTGVTSLNSITGVCVDASDNIYVVFDGGSNIGIKKYNSALVQQWSSTISGTSAAGGGHCTTDGTNLWVCSPNDSRVYKQLCSNGNDVNSFGGSGTTNGKFDTGGPYGITMDATYLYVSDPSNLRVQKFTLAGVYASQWTIPITPRGLAKDAAGNIVVVESLAAGAVARYSNTGTLIDSFSQVGPVGVAVATGDVIWVSDAVGATIAKWDEATTVTTTGTAAGELSAPESLDIKRLSGRIYVADTVNKRINYYTSLGVYEGTWGSAGTGDSQFGTLGPTGVAVNQTSGDVYVVDVSNYRVQQFTATGTFIREWGTNGTGNGQFRVPTCIDINPITSAVLVGDTTRLDVQEFTSAGSYLRSYGSSGSGDGQFTSITGLGTHQAGTAFYVADSALFRVQSFTSSTVVVSTTPAIPSLHYWTGEGWHGGWEHTDSSKTLTWAITTATSHTTDGYRLWWGCSDGKVYSIPLRRTFHNPRTGWRAGVDRFSATGYLISSRFNALMEGFYKKASRMVVDMDNATATETVRVQYRIDSEDMPWADFYEDDGVTVKYVTAIGRTVLEFGVDTDGFSWGEQFNWIQFKLSFARGSDTYQTPVMTSAVLNFTKVPQQARTFVFTIPFPKAAWNERTGIDIRDGLVALLRAGTYVKLVHQDTTYRGQLAGVAGLTSLGPNYYGGATVNFIEIPTNN